MIVSSIVNVCSTYASWRCIQLSMSFFAMLSPMASLVSITIGLLILDEYKQITSGNIIGALIILISIILFGYNRVSAEITPSNSRFILWITLYCLLAGFLNFSMRYFSVIYFSLGNFLLNWYFGACLGSLSLYALTNNRQNKGLSIGRTQFGLLFLLAFASFVDRILAYFILNKTPLFTVQPIIQVADLVLPLILGLYIFNERQNIISSQKLAIVIGFIGCVIIMAYS